MSSTELVEYVVGNETYLRPKWMEHLPYVSEEMSTEMSIQAILTAPDLDTALAPPRGKEPLEDYAGMPIKVLSGGWKPGRLPNQTLPVYVIFDFEVLMPRSEVSPPADENTSKDGKWQSDGQRRVITSGAPRVVAALERIAHDKAFPLVCRVSAIDTGIEGYSKMLGLVRVRSGEESF